MKFQYQQPNEISATHRPMSALTGWNFNTNNPMKTSVAWNFSYSHPNVCFDWINSNINNLMQASVAWNFSYSQPNFCFDWVKFQYQQPDEGFCSMKFQLFTAQRLHWHHKISIPTRWGLLLHEISATHSPTSSLTWWNFNTNKLMMASVAWNFSYSQPNICFDWMKFQ